MVRRYAKKNGSFEWGEMTSQFHLKFVPVMSTQCILPGIYPCDWRHAPAEVPRDSLSLSSEFQVGIGDDMTEFQYKDGY